MRKNIAVTQFGLIPKILFPVLASLLLLLTAGSLIAKPISSVFFNVREYGATGDGKHLDHLAIDKAIAACSEAGGGTVILPAGVYLCGSIHLRSNINLFLDAGAVIKGAPPEMNAYDKAETFLFHAYQDGGHTYFHNSLIWGEHLHNVSITGRGMIDGGGLTNRDHESKGDPTGGAIETGDKAIALKLCSNILIRDITIFHGGHFAILLTGCDLVTLDNLVIDTNRDGIDVDCCTNTSILNCKVNSPYDDAICPKSSYALNKPVITENLLISNCEVSGYDEGTLLDGRRTQAKVGWSNGRIKFGTESNGGFRNCVVSNCTFRVCNGLALEEVDGGAMDNIVVSNIVMIDVHHYPIYVTLGMRNRGPVETTHMGRVKNISISHVIITGSDSLSGIQITGSPGFKVEQIRLSDIQVTYKGGGTKAQGEKAFPELGTQYPEPFLLGMNPAYGLFLRHAKDIQLDHLLFKLEKDDFRPALYCEDVDGLEIDHFRAPKAAGTEVATFKNVKRLALENSPLLK